MPNKKDEAARIDRDIAKVEQREIGEALPYEEKPDKWAAIEKAMREGKVVSIEPLNQKNWR